MSDVVPLAEVADTAVFGSKAVGLGQALRDGLPVPPGVALSGPIVEAVAGGHEDAIEQVAAAVRPLGGPFAVRSSAVDEDGADASFAGQHLTLLNVPSADELGRALREIWWSANSDSAITYRKRVGLFTRPSVGRRRPGAARPGDGRRDVHAEPRHRRGRADDRGELGLGEAVVAGMVIPDSFRIDRGGEVLERRPGLKRIAIRGVPGGGTVEDEVPTELTEQLCLDDAQLAELNALALRCEQVYGPARDIEWAIAGGTLYLLQCRAVTRAG